MRGFTYLIMLAACLIWLAASTSTKAEDLLPAGSLHAGASNQSGAKPLLHPVRLCHTIHAHAAAEGLPKLFFVRLIWRESRFDPNAVSRAGAQGIAQFMPGTAELRHLDDPFDPAKALPKSAELLSDLFDRFGNLGLAAAAYNAGPRRVENWLADKSGLPKETRDYVEFITGKPAAYWRDEDTEYPHHLTSFGRTAEDWCLTRPAPIWAALWSRYSRQVRVAEDLSLRDALKRAKDLRDALDKVERKAVRPFLVPLDKTDRDGRPRFAVTLSVKARRLAHSICTNPPMSDAACRIRLG